jgi:hypothetical protein
MTVLKQNYHRRVEEGTWNMKSVKTDKERIIALETTITELKASPTAARRERNNDDKYAWKKVPPKAGKPRIIKKGSKTCNWCPKHLAWCITM